MGSIKRPESDKTLIWGISFTGLAENKHYGPDILNYTEVS